MRKLLGIGILCAIAASAMAVPARREGMLRTAADGTEKMVFLNGDESFHYLTDENGIWLDEETLMPLTEEIKNTKLNQKAEGASRHAKARRAKQETGTSRLLAPRGAVILVSYADKNFKSTNAEMTDWAMGENYTYNGATGSIHKYFLDQSWGEYDMQIDVYGPVTVSQNAAYYGENDWSGDDKHADELVVEACKLAHDNCGADFSKYDSNNDGKVDWVVILYAGYGEASGAAGLSNTIWPHQYELSYTGMSFKLDGKTVDHYCCLNELDYYSRKREGIGTFCHEFSHVMGLPDFYETNYQTTGIHTLCEWDIMDYGPYNNNGNTPPNYSAYERWFMGWIRPTLITDACSVTLPALHDTKAACYMTENGSAISDILDPDPTTFYIFENRQKSSGWDAYIPGSGMMITKIKFSATKWEGNTVNNSSRNMGVDIIEAVSNNSDSGKASDLYPGSTLLDPTGVTSFTDIANYQVENIAMANKIITFDVNGGGENITLEVENVQRDNVQCTKVLLNGQVVIVRGGKTYDVTGRLVD